MKTSIEKRLRTLEGNSRDNGPRRRFIVCDNDELRKPGWFAPEELPTDLGPNDSVLHIEYVDGDEWRA